MSMDLLSSLWRASWQGAFVIVAIYALCRLLEARFPQSANLRCWLWRLGYLKLLLGLVAFPAVPLAVLPATPAPVIIRTVDPGNIAVSVSGQGMADQAAPASVSEAVYSAPVAPGPLDASCLFAGAYLLGVGICLGYVVRAGVRTRQVLRSARLCEDDSLNAEGERLARRMGLRRSPKLVLSPYEVPSK